MITKFKLFENIIDKDYDEIKEELINYMMNLYELDRDTILGIIEYNNTESSVIDYGYDALENYMIVANSIEELAEKFMRNDEGRYQLDLIEKDPENHKNYFKQKKIKKFNL
jgi:hypothetical protein